MGPREDRRMPSSLCCMKNLESLDTSDNNSSGTTLHFEQAFRQVHTAAISPAPGTSQAGTTGTSTDQKQSMRYFPIFLLIAFFLVFIVLTKKKSPKGTEEKNLLQNIQDSSVELVVAEDDEKSKVEKPSTLVFFGEEHEKFDIDVLLSSAAELQGQSFYSSLYKVTLHNNNVFAVKRLRKLQVSVEDFRSTMSWIGELKHPNLLPLVACHASEDEKLLVYRFQSRSLLQLLSNYADGSGGFPWKHRLSIANGIAKCLQYIAKVSCNRNMPHGNLKPSNILLNEFEEPQISEYGIQSFIDPKWEMLHSYNGYKAPEKNITEKADIFSFGVILLELLTGRTVEKSYVDLTKWVKAKIREEWTGEVFDREVNRTGGHWAFPLLNVALQCVSHVPEQRPTISDILEKIENVIQEQEDYSFSSTSSVESSKQDC